MSLTPENFTQTQSFNVIRDVQPEEVPAVCLEMMVLRCCLERRTCKPLSNGMATNIVSYLELTLTMTFEPLLLLLSILGVALIDVGEAMRELGEVKDALDMEVKQNFIDPMQNLHEKDIKEIQVQVWSCRAPPKVKSTIIIVTDINCEVDVFSIT